MASREAWRGRRISTYSNLPSVCWMEADSYLGRYLGSYQSYYHPWQRMFINAATAILLYLLYRHHDTPCQSA